MLALRCLLIGAVAIISSACAPTGLIYTNITVPLDVDFDATPMAELEHDQDIKTAQYYVRVVWGDASVGTIARRYGFREVHYADLQTLRVLGLWSQQAAIIYGTKDSD